MIGGIGMTNDLAGKVGVIYARQSDKKQTSSVPDQLKNARDLARELGIELPYPAYAETLSGDSARVQFQKLKSDIVSGSVVVDFVIGEDKNRISRQDYHDYCDDVKPLSKMGIWFLPFGGSQAGKPERFLAKRNDMGGHFQDYVKQHQSNHYLKNLAQLISDRSVPKAQNGSLYSGDIFGWDTFRSYDNKGKLVNWSRVPNSVDSEIVKEMFHRFLKTGILSDCCEILGKSPKYPKKRCLTCYSRLGRKYGLALSGDVTVCNCEFKDAVTYDPRICTGTEFESVTIGTPAVRAILRNQWHCGDYAWFKENPGKHRTRVDGKLIDVDEWEDSNLVVPRRQNVDPTKAEVYIENHHQGIIGRDIYLQVQKLLEKNKTDRSFQGRKRIGKFTGTLLCGCCGSRMNFAGTQGKPKYSCNPSKTKTSKVCPGGHKQIREEDVEDVLFGSVCDVLREPRFWFDKIQEVQKLVDERAIVLAGSGDDVRVDELKHKIKTLDSLIDGLDLSEPVASFKADKIIEQRLEHKKQLKKIVYRREDFNLNPAFELLKDIENGQRYKELVETFAVVENPVLMGIVSDPDRTEAVKIESLNLEDWGQYPLYFLQSEDGEIQLNFGDIDLMSELATGDYWSLLLLGYLLSKHSSALAMSLLLAQQFDMWFNGSKDSFNWSSVIGECRLTFCPAEDRHKYPLAEKLYKKGNKRVVCGYELKISPRTMSQQKYCSQ
jgi:hypothetical protein